MEYLEFKEFLLAEELCNFVNLNAVKALTITKRGEYFVLFYKKRLD